MGVGGQQFLGRNYYRPGAYGAFRAEPQPLGPSDDISTLILIGQASNGVDCNDTALLDNERYYIFSDYQTAKAVLRGGELLEAIKMAFAPSTETDFRLGPQYIKAFNINPNVAASASPDTTKAANPSTINAIVAGPAGNLVRFRKNLTNKTIEIGNDEGLETSPPLGVDVMDLTYTGDASTAVLAVTATAITVTLAGDQTDGSVNLSVPFAQYPTLGDAVNYINQQTSYVATSAGGYDFDLTNLDHVEASEAVSVLTLKTLTADAYGEEVYLNNSGLVTITVAAVRKPLANQTVFTYLSGGSTGTPAGTDYADAITFSEKVTGIYANILSTVQSDQIAFRDSINVLNSPDGANERFGGVGAASADGLTARKAAARLMNSEFMVYGVTKFNQFNVAGAEETFPGKFLAVIHNAIKASVSPHRTATFKALNIIDTDEVHTKLEREQIIQAGGLAIANRVKGNARVWVIERAVTTYQQANLILNEASSVATALVMVKELREMFNANFIGETPVDQLASDQGTAVGPTEGDIKTAFEQKMDEYVTRGFLRGSTLLDKVAWDRTGYQIEINGDAFYFRKVDANITVPLNFVFYLLNLDVIRGSTTAAGGQ